MTGTWWALSVVHEPISKYKAVFHRIELKEHGLLEKGFSKWKDQ